MRTPVRHDKRIPSQPTFLLITEKTTHKQNVGIGNTLPTPAPYRISAYTVMFIQNYEIPLSNLHPYPLRKKTYLLAKNVGTENTNPPPLQNTYVHSKEYVEIFSYPFSGVI